MADESAMQAYLTYDIDRGSDDDSDGTLYVIPDEGELAMRTAYEIHSVTPCRENDLKRVAFGPANEPCN